MIFFILDIGADMSLYEAVEELQVPSDETEAGSVSNGHEDSNVANGHALIEFIVHGVLLSIVAIAGKSKKNFF